MKLNKIKSGLKMAAKLFALTIVVGQISYLFGYGIGALYFKISDKIESKKTESYIIEDEAEEDQSNYMC